MKSLKPAKLSIHSLRRRLSTTSRHCITSSLVSPPKDTMANASRDLHPQPKGRYISRHSLNIDYRSRSLAWSALARKTRCCDLMSTYVFGN